MSQLSSRRRFGRKRTGDIWFSASLAVASPPGSRPKKGTLDFSAGQLLGSTLGPPLLHPPARIGSCMRRKSRARNSVEPTRFHVFIGGFGRSSYDVRLVSGRLHYQDNSAEAPEILSPTAEDWERFWSATEVCDLWNWTTSYHDPDILDGTQWKVEITLGRRRLKSSGSNAHPGGNSDGRWDSFMLFLRAVRKLLGGRQFG